MATELKSVICDIDGVLMHDNQLIPGADRFIKRLQEQGNPLVLLTNNPAQTAKDLANRLGNSGIHLPDSAFYTSAMATAHFLRHQSGNKAYVIGEGALTHELYQAGFTITDIDPDFVVVGETRSFNWDMIHRAANFVANGARFIATNPDTHGPSFSPACSALCAPIERITGKTPFYVGKPSSWIVRSALDHLGSHSGDTVIVGDNMNTDIKAGVQAGLESILVLSGVTGIEELDTHPFRPTHIFPCVAEIDVV
ncbi:HAD-IIA family hydrolase [Ferrimonas futtsuensis]|uniref:HAD-IIA family hydrolase n=1 Tax=Ferrimonas futtsuensis TaxID=364764 RepID=UPI000426840C|nr:HAD-IIA family hydrolase [Ferrimonas futtsuensis]